ncbi:glycine zipper 2TM domain-containing protein [Gammaproteobacteria bacterium]|jgi:outer membrane lipoprotein SlyB|nr:glycine zipper 2TM domain-containing protein [Gammaproteobacteria bacterium]
MIKNKFLIIILLGLFTASCVNISQQPTTVSRGDVQKQQSITLGTILDITNVTIEGDRRLGAAAGAAIGGVAGKNTTDSDTESDIASVLGALAGSAIGASIGSAMTKKNGVELLIETTSGRLVSIIQESSDVRYEKNQKVRIIKRNGKSRVLPID